MSLDILLDPKAHCTLCREFTYRLAWRPEKHYVAGAQLEIRSHCLRAFHSWRFTGFRMKGGDITFRWKVRPTVSERWHNRDRVLLRARLPCGARQGEPIELELTFGIRTSPATASTPSGKPCAARGIFSTWISRRPATTIRGASTGRRP